LPALIPKTNNLDLIRLGAAAQVAITHSIAYFVPRASDSYLLRFIELFPGVPVFFFVSGFLISKSFEKNSNIREYALNRLLRIYPGLWVCFIVSLAMVTLSGYFRAVHPAMPELLLWVLGQLSFAQFFNPDFMRAYGAGVLNGSMWSIPVELQFYALTPALYALFRLAGRTAHRANAVLIILICVFWLLQHLYVAAELRHGPTLELKLIGVSFLPWLYMFLVGVLCQRNAQRLLPWLDRRAAVLFAAYVVLAAGGNAVLGWNIGNTMGLPLFLALAAMTLAAAFSHPGLSDRLLRRNDISYGVYVYHMPIVNLLLVLGLGGTVAGFLLTMATTLLCAGISWSVVEKPALRWKKHPLYSHEASETTARTQPR
jgi:peptidoglycan/LPS O-acetylase OafA/YrhL